MASERELPKATPSDHFFKTSLTVSCLNFSVEDSVTVSGHVMPSRPIGYGVDSAW